MYWYQPIANGKIELELGWLTNQLDFVGIYVGGSPSGGTVAPQASLPFQAGMSFGSFAAPTASAKIN
jgi:porin